jgi:hypothetical protein
MMVEPIPIRRKRMMSLVAMDKFLKKLRFIKSQKLISTNIRKEMK